MRLLITMMLALAAFSCFGQADSTNTKPVVVKNDTLPAIKLTALQIEDIRAHQLRVSEFKIRVEAESNALQREYQSMMKSVIHSNNIANYVDWIIEADKLKVIVPKQKKP